jgi:UDPglucose 6-dehydrogenase
MREATSRVLIAELLARGASVSAYDPVANDEARRIYGDTSGLHLVARANEALTNADALIIVTEWKEFRSPDFTELKALLKAPIIFDGRNLYDPGEVSKHGVEYHAIGRRA